MHARPWIETALADVRYAIRALRHQPAYAVVAILTLALGIGANTAIFSVVDGVLLRPLPYPAPDKLMSISTTMMGGRGAVSGPDFMDWRAQSKSFSGLTAAYTSETVLTGSGEAERFAQARVSANALEVLGIQPLLGRGFRSGEDDASAPRVALLGERLWRSRFGGDSSIIGRSITLDGFPTQVIGVVPSTIRWPEAVDLWLTTRFSARDISPGARGARWITVVGRLRNDVTPAKAQAEMTTIARRLAALDPAHNRDVGTDVRPLLTEMVGDVRKSLWVLLGAVGLVLLIACSNVASLTIGRMASRDVELAVRKALGASRPRILRQAITESLVLGVIGGIAGIAVAWAGIRALVRLAPADLPRLNEVSMSPSVLLFTLVATVTTGLLFGLVPALSAANADPQSRIRSSRTLAGGSQFTRRALIVVEVGLAVVLLSGAGLLMRSFGKLSQVDPGFRPDSALAFGIALPSTRYGSLDQQRAFTTELLARVRALPGVAAAGVSFSLPLSGSSFGFTFDIDGRVTDPRNEPRAQARVADADYFKAMGMRLTRGRMFDATDVQGSRPVVVISEEVAKRYFANEDPIGKRVRTGWGQGNAGRFGGEVVGVVTNVRQRALDGPVAPHIYMPYAQWPLDEYSVVVRGSAPPDQLIAATRASIRQMDPDIPMIEPRPLTQLVDAALGNRRFYVVLLGVFAASAMVLAAVGLYGVVAYSVQRRRREIGIRLALGSTQGGVLRMVLGEGLRLTAIGAVLGLAAAFAVTRVLGALLFETDAHDPATLAIAPLLLALVAIGACVMPARRAAGMNPVETIRSD